MNSPVKIKTDDNGMVIRQSKNNSEYGHIVLQQSRVNIQSNPANPKNLGWVKTNNMTALLKGTIDELKLFGFTKDTVLPGKIVVKESTTPFSEENPDADLKIAGNTGIVCCKDGEPIYRITYYTADATEEDEFVAHDNVDAIRQANGNSQYVAKPVFSSTIDPLDSDDDEEDEDDLIHDEIEDDDISFDL
jgi:hypothetical protein